MGKVTLPQPDAEETRTVGEAHAKMMKKRQVKGVTNVNILNQMLFALVLGALMKPGTRKTKTLGNYNAEALCVDDRIDIKVQLL